MTIRGDLQVLIANERHEPADDIARYIFDALTSGDFLSVLLKEEIDVSNYCAAIDILKDRCLLK